MKTYYLLILSSLSCVLSGCGQTGPLYLPDAPPPIHTERPKPEATDEVKDQTSPAASDPSKSNTNPSK